MVSQAKTLSRRNHWPCSSSATASVQDTGKAFPTASLLHCKMPSRKLQCCSGMLSPRSRRVWRAPATDSLITCQCFNLVSFLGWHQQSFLTEKLKKHADEAQRKVSLPSGSASKAPSEALNQGAPNVASEARIHQDHSSTQVEALLAVV